MSLSDWVKEEYAKLEREYHSSNFEVVVIFTFEVLDIINVVCGV